LPRACGPPPTGYRTRCACCAQRSDAENSARSAATLKVQ
jgi:hypothetical protein